MKQFTHLLGGQECGEIGPLECHEGFIKPCSHFEKQLAVPLMFLWGYLSLIEGFSTWALLTPRPGDCVAGAVEHCGMSVASLVSAP